MREPTARPIRPAVSWSRGSAQSCPEDTVLRSLIPQDLEGFGFNSQLTAQEPTYPVHFVSTSFDSQLGDRQTVPAWPWERAIRSATAPTLHHSGLGHCILGNDPTPGHSEKPLCGKSNSPVVMTRVYLVQGVVEGEQTAKQIETCCISP